MLYVDDIIERQSLAWLSDILWITANNFWSLMGFLMHSSDSVMSRFSPVLSTLCD